MLDHFVGSKHSGLCFALLQFQMTYMCKYITWNCICYIWTFCWCLERLVLFYSIHILMYWWYIYHSTVWETLHCCIVLIYCVIKEKLYIEKDVCFGSEYMLNRLDEKSA